MDKKVLKVLVVDDEEAIRRILKTYLVKWGYDVKEAVDGEQALEVLSDEDVDLIILDILMPNKDGWQVLKEVKLNPKTKDIPIIVLTVKNKDPDMFKGYKLGASYFITKPFTKAQLLYGLKLTLGEDFGSINYISR